MSAYGKSDCSSRFGGTYSILGLTFGITEILTMTVLSLLLRFKSTAASWYQGDTAGVKDGVTLILPVYYSVCVYTLVIGILAGVLALFGATPLVNPFLSTAKWIFIRFCTEGLAIFFLHNGIGGKAFWNSVLGGAVWAILSGIIPIIAYVSSPASYNFILYASLYACNLTILITFYTVTGLLPQRILHRRPGLIRFARLNCFVCIIFIIDIALVLDRFSRDSCEVVSLSDLCYLLQPLIILHALRQDTMFWQGLYSTAESNLNQPLLGIWEMGRETIGFVADTISRLERRVVPIIPFGQLRVDTRKFFSGGTARVYRGQFKQHDVALKFLFNLELTPANVISFCDEATLLNSLQHPNIVKCYGVAVMPPALCLVTEFCEFGSLYDFLYSLEYVIKSKATAGEYQQQVSHKDDYSPAGGATKRKSDKSSHLTEERISVVSVLNQKDNDVESGEELKNIEQLEEASISAIQLSHNPGQKSFQTRNSAGSALDRKSLASQLVEAIRASQGQPAGIGKDSSVHFDDYCSDIESNNPKSFVSGSTLEKFGFSNRMSSDKEINQSVKNAESKSSFLSVLKSTLLRSKQNLNNSMIAGGKMMKSAATVLRSPDMGYGLGPNANLRSSQSSMRSTNAHKSIKSNISDNLISAEVSGSKVFILRESFVDASNHGSRQSAQGSRQSLGQYLPLLVRLNMARDAAAGVAFLHSHGLMHCDIKSLNFLVTKDLIVKLADLGEARQVKQEDNSEVKSFPRNINWSSPEVLAGSQAINQSADVWSLAFVMTEIFSGKVPFDSEEYRLMSLEAFQEAIQLGLRPSLPETIVSKNPWILEMVSSAWTYEPSNRLTAVEIVGILDTNIQSMNERLRMGVNLEQSYSDTHFS